MTVNTSEGLHLVQLDDHNKLVVTENQLLKETDVGPNRSNVESIALESIERVYYEADTVNKLSAVSQLFIGFTIIISFGMMGVFINSMDPIWLVLLVIFVVCGGVGAYWFMDSEFKERMVVQLSSGWATEYSRVIVNSDDPDNELWVAVRVVRDEAYR